VRLVLIDRDGVINEDHGQPVRHPGELRLIEGSGAALARLNQAGIRIALASNQAVVGRGEIDAGMLERINGHLRDLLAREGARLDAIFVCTDPPERATDRRKPGPGMLREALLRFDARAAATPFVGDKLSDLEAAYAAGCPRVLVRTGHGAATQAKGVPGHLLPVAVHETLADWVASYLGGGVA
jgi:D-glycero-D-manno-heptose 1,7-bisphosphate phosphatase